MHDSWHSYPSIYNLGHAALAELLDGAVVVEEKVDGSQFSFGRFGGELRVRSKGQQLDPRVPERMFAIAIEVAASLDCRDGWTYRAEYLQKPRHNGLAYDRVPAKHLIVFDINPAQERYLSYAEKAAEAARLGLETVPCLHDGPLDSLAVTRKLLERTSVLGGAKIEGVVVKNYAKFGPDRKALMGKHVSEAFKEVQAKAWRQSNPGRTDILEHLLSRYTSEARWAKAVQHLREAGKLEGSPRDIAILMQEVQDDILRECRDEIAETAFKWVWEKTRRKYAAGLPQWYKDQLLAAQFEQAKAS
jgi:hypothetical protein